MPYRMYGYVLERLQVIETAYLDRTISYVTYDSWMRLNSGNYQLGSNDKLLSLWDDRLEKMTLMNEQTTDTALARGHYTSLKASRNKVTEADFNLPSPYRVKEMMMKSNRLYSIQACKMGGYHIKFFLHNKSSATRTDFKFLNQLFPWLESEDKQKTNIDLASLAYYAYKEGEKRRLKEFSSVVAVGMPNTVATAMLLLILGNPTWPLISKLISADQVCCMDLSSFKSYFRALSIAVRRTSRWVDGSKLTVKEVAAAAYVELATGRAANVTDWEEEKKKRVGPHLPLIDPTTGGDLKPRVRKHLIKIIQEILPPNDNWGRWEDFVKARQRWSPAGSAGGKKLTVNNEVIRLNKHSYFENTPTEEVLGWIDTKPRLQARGSEKMEPGKSRAIYATGVIDQTLVTYVIGKLEARMGRVKSLVNNHIGLREVADIGARLLNVTSGSIECTMLDFADFNYQHTIEMQYILFDVIYNELKRYRNADLSKAAKWVRDAQLNQTVRFPNDITEYRVTQGMFSGVRSTDFTNTLLNLAYISACMEIVEERAQIKPIELFHLHKGDDVWVTNKSRLWAILLYKTMEEAGFVFQASKQMFDQNRAEFLRVLYTDNGALGYMMRSVATFIIKPIQSVLDLAPQNRATAYTSQIHLLYRRGFHPKACKILWNATVPYALKMRLPDKSGTGIPLAIAMKPYALGGLDLGPPGTMAAGTHHTKSVPAPQPYTKNLEKVIGRNMSHDWIEVISAQVKDTINSERLENALHASNVTDSLRPEDNLRTMRYLEKEIKAWREKLGSEVNREDGHRVGFEFRDVELSSLPQIVKLLKLAISSNMAGEVEIAGPFYIVDTIIQGVAASPLRDISSAKQAWGCSTLKATKECLLLAADTAVGNKAMTYLEYLEDKFGAEVTTTILNGIRGVGTSYESKLHPIVLSLVCKRATDCAIISSRKGSIVNEHQWNMWLETWMTGLITACVKELQLDNWSHY